MALEIQQKGGKIFAPLKDKWLTETPEETVRQNYICTLVNDYGYSLDQMEQELNLTNSQRGTGRARADIIVWESEDHSKSPVIIVECKAQNITIKEADYFQGQNYAYFSGAKFFVTTNEKETKYFQVKQGEFPKHLGNEIIAIPHAKDLKDEKKIEKLLNATKIFERDEFAKLLFACHNVIRDNDKFSPEMAFDEISKILFIKIWYERKQARGKIFSLEKFKELKKANDEFAAKDDKPFYQKIFDNVKADYQQQDLFDVSDNIKLRENSIESIIQKLEKYNLSDTSDDVKGIAFEEFLGKTFRGELGQFFTPRTLVDFMVETLDPQEGETICDPCCGSGGFLIKAFEYIRESIEKEIEIEKERIKNQYFDEKFEKASDKEKEATTQKVNELLAKLNDELNPSNKKSRLYNLSNWSIYGTDANPRMARTAKMNMIMHGDGHGGVHHNDGLLNINGIFEKRFDVILTNPPFGSQVSADQKITEEDKYTDTEKIKYYNERYGDEYKQAVRQVTDNIGKPLLNLFDTGIYSKKTETLFIERCLNLLNPGGRMGIVLPEGVLNNPDLQRIREYVEGRAKILFIVSIPSDVFKSSKATVKPSIVFLKRFTEDEEKQYNDIVKAVSEEKNAEFAPRYEVLDNKIADADAEWKNEKDKTKKKELSDTLKAIKKKVAAERKKLDTEKTTAIKAEVKERFDYQIPVAEVEKAGIDSKGAKIENDLEPIAKAFSDYRNEKNLWEILKRKNGYSISDDGEISRITMLNEPQATNGK
ncbi:MAG: N-6 DNA methylase [Bacteroidales bacterium]|jgi:type I restriction enzyme M protein|nr:N-6 DNA methylase [Bacteroidales bacterium]